MIYYIVTGILALFCIAVIILVFRVYHENKKLIPEEKGGFEEDEDVNLIRP